MDQNNIVSSIPDYLRRNKPNPVTSKENVSSQSKLLIDLKNRGLGGGSEHTKENWRKTNEHPFTSDKKEFNRRRNDSNWRNDRQNDVHDQRYNRSGATKNTNFNRNPFKKNENQFTDDEFITELLSNEDDLEVANALSNTQRFVKILIFNICDDLLVKILQLVARLLNSTRINNKNFFLRSIMQQKFIKQLNSFISLLALSNKKELTFWQEFDSVLKNIITILDNVLNLMPMTMWEHVKSITQNLNIVLPALKSDQLVDISHSAEKMLVALQIDIQKIEKVFKEPEEKINEDQAKVVSEDQEKIENSFETSYRIIDPYPDITELTIRDRPYLRKNIVDRPYTSVAQYLDIQYRLLREDFVNSIREDICDYINKTNRRLFNIKIYKNTKFLERVAFQDKHCFKISFDLPKWISKSLENREQMKRFIHGTMLLFTHDNFNTMLCGKVVSCDDLKNGCIVVEMHSFDVDMDKTYLMFECIVFFEPYYQVLSVLQHIHPRSLPMEDYIIHIKKDAKRPRYMPILPYLNVSGLNSSQEAALKAAMSKEFVIIQGPPGTGKTFLGMKILKEILELRQYWQHQGPILIICFTNHALDQFLNGLRSSTEKIARLGGQSNSLKEINEKFGPESLIRQKFETIAADMFSDNDFQLEAAFREIVCDLKRGFRYKKGYSELNYIYDYLNARLPFETREWLRERGQMNQWFFNLKNIERSIKTNKQFITNMDTLSTFGILKADLLLNYRKEYYFTDSDLVRWLIYDDGTIQTKVETVENVGLVHTQDTENYDIENPLNKLLNSLFSERSGINDLSDDIKGLTLTSDDLPDDIKGFALPFETLRNHLYDLEKFIKSHPYDRSLQDYIKYVKRKVDYLRVCLTTNFDLPENNTINVDLWTLTSKSRWQLYGLWKSHRKRAMVESVEREILEYRQLFNAYNTLRDEDNIKLLKKMDIVGMTTTCAARMRSTLEELRSPIVVVEEAAEVLESHIVTALTNNCQHLILLGDHQQLRPATSDYTIEKKFNLGISLFERMVMNNVECHTLNVQHRMRPEISTLLKPTFYKDLEDSESVKSYPMVNGVTCPLYFLDHTEPEEPYGDSSKMNMHEAKFLIQLAIYLLKNDYLPEEITILAAYLGQTHILKEERDKSNYSLVHKVHITPVDNFQGEENKIILLSLVRSNTDSNIGFLKVDNRVCVALSRAREGFYVMGNMVQLCASSEIWKPIKASLQAQNAIGKFLSLACRNHVDSVTLVLKPSDFQKVREGGCDLQCNKELICGHKCNRKCHGYDRDHKNYICEEPCKELLCDIPEHKCKKLCHEFCGDCGYLVEKLLPCGHKITVACFTEFIHCKQLVEVQHDKCKHAELVECFKATEGNFDCMVKVEKQLPCGHKEMVPCHVHAKDFQCLVDIEVQLACNHSVSKKCYEADAICKIKCQKEMKCGHLCPRYCHKDDDPKHFDFVCMEPCLRTKIGCKHPDQHPKCYRICDEECGPCTEVTFSLQTCSHLSKSVCYQKQSVRCENQCSKELSCGHACLNRCYESCTTTCTQITFKIIPECGHKIKLKCYKTPQHSMCLERCSKLLPCGHSCQNACVENCTETCLTACNKELECAHKCCKRCSEPCACKREKYPECDHYGYVKCGDILKQEDCRAICNKLLECGHLCCQKCDEKCKCTDRYCKSVGFHEKLIKSFRK